MVKRPKQTSSKGTRPEKSGGGPRARQQVYPSTRYLQIHFEYLQGAIEGLRQEVRDVGELLARLEARLDQQESDAPLHSRETEERVLELPPTPGHGR